MIRRYAVALVATTLLLGGTFELAYAELVPAPPRSYAVTLAADPTTLETGEHSTLTTTASEDLTGTRWTTYLFDQTDPAWYRTCKVQACSFDVSQTTEGTHTYVAYIARERSDPRFPPSQTQATSEPVSVTWAKPTYSVSLVTDETWLPLGTTARLTATSNRDVGGRPFAIQIYDVTAGERIAVCTSGVTCETAVMHVTPTTRTYQAFVAAPGTTPPPPDIQASSDLVTITWSPLPDPTRPPNVGGGLVGATVTFTGAGVPPLGEACLSTTFDFAGTADSAWVNGSRTAYLGPVALSGSGAGCDAASVGTGALSIRASGTNALGHTLSCGPLTGTYTRVLTDLTISLTGDCTINGVTAFRVGFLTKGEAVPVNEGGGVSAHVHEATFTGAFAVFPN